MYRYDPSFALPYPSARQPVLAANVVATSQPLAAQAGLRMLHRGGNAVDAALAAAIALTVVEPTGNGLGSDAFAIVWDGSSLHGLNASGRAPAAIDAERFLRSGSMSKLGWDAVTVPGAVSAWSELSRRFGRLPFEDLFQPAISYAEAGFPVSPGVARGWAGAAKVLGIRPDFAQAFMPGGSTPAAGTTWRFPAQARSLRLIAESGGDAFYRGELADAMVAAAAAEGGPLSHQDLAGHTADWVGTLAADFAGGALHEIPPNGQGLAALLALGILRHTDLAGYQVDSADWVHVQVEAMKLALADAHRYIADPAHMEVGVETLLDDAYLASRAAAIDMRRAADPLHGAPRPGGTVYLATADHNGMMVSYIQSNYFGFGSGVVVPDTGISLQNRGMGFSLQHGHPNAVAGGKRPFHTIIPGFLMAADGQPLASFGVMGGPMQAQGHVQMTVRLLVHGQNPQAASDAPRWQVGQGRELLIEPGFPATVPAELLDRGHELHQTPPEQSFSYGGAQLIARLPDGAGYVAGSDHRKDGQAVGF
ncbi:MAG TPA: gamma-glutamyltransferase family protein [Trueperaceae bacterium]|nr:gamma-glutamyltransferase family protein [Trueperaceae bacterium]